jgi:uncharacterized protein YbbC (DUF1343 family)
LFEGTNVSEGRGTYEPFLRIGAPWLNTNQINGIIHKSAFTNANIDPVSFTPRSIPAMSPDPKHLNSELNGISISVTDRNTYKSYLSGIILVKYFYEADKENFVWRQRHFDRLCGTNKIREMIIDGADIQEIESWIESSLESFLTLRTRYLRYD